MGVTAIIDILKAAASIFFGFARTRVGNILIAFAIAWTWSGWRHDAACDAREKAAEAARQAATRIEQNRRMEEIGKARSAALFEAMAQARAEAAREALRKESEDASQAHDARPCLDAASVLRLDRIGR